MRLAGVKSIGQTNDTAMSMRGLGKILCNRDERTAYNGKPYKIKVALKSQRSPWKNESMTLCI